MAPVASRPGDAGSWQGESFSVFIEYFAGAARVDKRNATVSMPVDAGRYTKCAFALRSAIESYFSYHLPVKLVPSCVPYALEVDVRACRLKGVQATGSPAPKLVFSKIQVRHWPKAEEVLAGLLAFCRVPVRLVPLRPPAEEREQDEDTDVEGSLPSEGGANSSVPFCGMSLCISHRASGSSLAVRTNEEGIADVVLFPGVFQLRLGEEHSFEEVSPDTISLTACFKLQTQTLSLEPCRWFTICVTDHREQVLADLPLSLLRQPRAHADLPRRKVLAQALHTDAAGLCRCLLPAGRYRLASVHDEQSQAAPLTLPFSHDFDAGGAGPDWLAVAVQRVRFPVEVQLRTSGSGDPVPGCDFAVRSFASPTIDRVAEAGQALPGVTDERGVALMDLLVGDYELRFTPGADSLLDEVVVPLVLRSDGTFFPQTVEMHTRAAKVRISFVTPDGEPAEDCPCRIVQRQASGMLDQQAQACALDINSGSTGTTEVRLTFFEHYLLQVSEDVAGEYEHRVQPFTMRGTSLTVVVRRNLFAPIPEQHFTVVVDASSQVVRENLRKLAAALQNTLLERQRDAQQARFQVLRYIQEVEQWRRAPEAVSAEAASAAAAFLTASRRAVATSTAGDPCAALEAALAKEELEAVYFIVGQDTMVDDYFIKRAQVAYYKHSQRPRVHSVLLGPEPRKGHWRHVQALALLSKGTFRPVATGDLPCAHQSPRKKPSTV